MLRSFPIRSLPTYQVGGNGLLVPEMFWSLEIKLYLRDLTSPDYLHRKTSTKKLQFQRFNPRWNKMYLTNFEHS